jgi:hypothetical protein
MTQDTRTDPEVIVDATDPVEMPPVTKAETEDILDIVDDLIVHLHEAKTMPLSSNALVDREVFLTRLETLRASLPDELRAARWMVREREAFISRTNEKAREIIDNARTEADALVAESNIVAEAVEEANILVRRAEGDSRRLRLETEDDVERKLQKLEHLLVELTAQVQTSRAEFHQARPKPPEVPI